jgi:MFS family permease
LALAITAGRISDRIGRKITTIFVVSVAGIGFALFYSGLGGFWLPPLWVLSFFGFFSGEAMIAGFALEIMPTRYRATVSALRYVAEIGTGAISLALEGRLYDHFHGHGPAIQLLLSGVLITVAAILFLPEPAGKTLEEMTT